MEIITQQVGEAFRLLYGKLDCQRSDRDYLGLEKPGYQPLYCLFFRKEDIPKKCLQTCGLARWRFACESSSPSLFGAFVEVSDARRRLHNLIGGEQEGVSGEQLRESHAQLYQLIMFIELVSSAIYPLFFANGSEFPFLTPKEIEKAREAFTREGVDCTVKEMKELSPEWHHQLAFKLQELDPEYAAGVYSLVKLFLEGAKKGQEGLFKKIEEFCAKEAR